MQTISILLFVDSALCALCSVYQSKCIIILIWHSQITMVFGWTMNHNNEMNEISVYRKKPTTNRTILWGLWLLYDFRFSQKFILNCGNTAPYPILQFMNKTSDNWAMFGNFHSNCFFFSVSDNNNNNLDLCMYFRCSELVMKCKIGSIFSGFC